MCGASSFSTSFVVSDPCSRRLQRNGSSNSSLVSYSGLTKDDTAAQDDRLQPYTPASSSEAWDTSMVDGIAASTCCSTLSSFQPRQRQQQQQPLHTRCAPAAAPTPAVQAASQQLLLGTSAGIYQLDLASLQLQQLALASVPVAHVCYSSCGLLLAACPVADEGLYSSPQAVAAAKEAAGLYCLNMRPRGSCSSSAGSCFGGTTQASKLWQGGATCCAFAPAQPGCEGPALPRIYLGTQPADLIYSDNLGASWASCALSKAPQADNWFRRLPPYEPSVRAINFSSSSSNSNTAAAAAGGGVQQQQQQRPELLVAVEVGGVLCGTQQQQQQQQEAQPGSSGWVDCSQGLCRDVHALQADPFNPRMLYAVSGSGHLPGGLYRCKGKGQKWKRLFGYRYAVGMAISPYQKGHMLLVTADKAPATGCNLFESLDGGRCWHNLTDDVTEAAAVLTEHEPVVFDQAPLAMFVPGGVVIACASGHLFHGSSRPMGGFTNWKLLATIPAAINCMCSTDAAVAPVAVQRS